VTWPSYQITYESTTWFEINTMVKVKVKGIVIPVLFNWAPRHEGVLGEWMYSSTHSLTSALNGGEWSASRPCRFTPKERATGTHWIGGWVGPRAVLDAVVKRKIPSPRRESNSKTPIVQPVAQHYTDWAITALISTMRHIYKKTLSLVLKEVAFVLENQLKENVNKISM
jgi:hypothetical protein